MLSPIMRPIGLCDEPAMRRNISIQLVAKGTEKVVENNMIIEHDQ
jgi:hypothetical protein